MAQESFAGGDDVDYSKQTPIFQSPLHKDTNVIISSYENKIAQSIAFKVLSASRRDVAPEFTKEELLYLNKRADEADDTELKVITPTPAITLKKGKTELNIGHAAVLVQKMEEKYPTNSKRAISDDEMFQEEEIPQSQAFKFRELAGITQPTEIKSVNKNAYEIREAILAHALDWVKYTNDFKAIGTTAPNEDEVISVAQKFYKFVENKR